MSMSNMSHPGSDGNGNLMIAAVEGEPRLRDIDLGVRLGFSQGRDVRKIIARHRGALQKLGPLVELDEIVGRGQRVTVTYMNRKQAIFITAKSDTTDATDITIEIIEKFDAYERGAVRTVTDPMQVLNDPAAMRGLLLNYTERVMVLQAEVKHLQPAAAAYERVAGTDGLLCLTDAAKVLGQQPKAFNRWLFAEKYIYKRPGSSRWVAYQASIQSGWLDHKMHLYQKADGTDASADQVMVTRKGMMRFAKQLGVTLPPDLIGLCAAE